MVSIADAVAGVPGTGRAPSGFWRTAHAYLVVSRTLVALPNTVPFVVGALLGGLDLRTTALFTGWALLFYSYSCKVNDLADYRWDRHNAGRTRSPILKGTVLPEQVGLWAAFELIALTAAVAAAPLPLSSRTALLGLVVLTTYGNAFQKRSRVVSPLIMDHLFGLTMALPVIICAALGSVVTTPAILLSTAFGYQMIVLNSYSGNMKDLEHDLEVGAATTAVRLGVRRIDTRTWRIPAAYRGFLLYAQVTSTIAVAACLALSSRPPTLLGALAVLSAVAALPALIHRLEAHSAAVATPFTAGQSDALTRFVSRPPHLVLNAAAFLFAAAHLTGFWPLPLLVAVSLAAPKAVLLGARHLTSRRKSR